MKKLSFLIQISKIHFKMYYVYYRILGCETLWYENDGPLNNLNEKSLLFTSERGIWFEKIYKPIVIENFKLIPLCPIKMAFL